MEPASIDWKNVNSIYVEDELYEHINAPKFIDFTAPDDPVDDEAWFCKPDCKHPKTAEDFRRSYPNSKSQAKFIRALSSISEPLLLGDRNCRDSYLKRRLHNDQRPPESHGDSENQNPNLSTPPPRNPLKAVFKSSAQKKKCNKQQLGTSSPAESSQERRNPQLKTTLSARNLFSGKEILSQITELCGELKKLATRATEKEGCEKSNEEKTVLVNEKKTLFQELLANGCSVDLSDKVDEQDERVPLFAEKENEKESKPLLAQKVNLESPTSNGKQKLRRKKKFEDTENIPMSLDLKKIVGENSLQVRTNPPSPQCFSATRGPLRSTKAITPLKTIKSMPAERGILQEVGQNSSRLATSDDQLRGEEIAWSKNISHSKSTTGGGSEEARSLDIFWFLKPCTMSS
ncbi:hypothetical protein C5167_045882 [Papaver somniferum]|uniref:Uncharacterized protein n=1 Tax=Papaver somniferum TaxID=3469 RepID=A0A4Y7LG01_PAPSO|nr:uncharacterized protein LOC113323559 isoform X3 [Papaver somniferum]RZC83095.1 hypothetical protein C5167_045882 [Papaver somniferum]